MENELFEYKQKICLLHQKEKDLRDLYLRKLAKGEIKGPVTGIPSLDKPWLKYYEEEQILSPLPNMTAYEYLRILNSNNLNLIALEDPMLGIQLTYKDLFKKINLITKSLSALNVKPREVVSIILPPCLEEVYLFYAIDQIGACTNFIFPGTPIDEVENNMKELNSKKLIAFDDLLSQPNTLIENEDIKIVSTSFTKKYKNKYKNVLVWEDFEKSGQSLNMSLYVRNHEEPLYIAKTGGSTGKPKKVILTDKSFNLQVHQHLNSPINYCSGDRWVRVWPMFSASSAVASVHLPLCYGMTQIIEHNVDIDKLDELILNYKPSHMVMISSCIESLLKSELIKGKDLSFIKTLGIGGESVTAELEEKANQFMIEHNITSSMTYGYGMTENGSGATSRFNKETGSIGSVGVPQVNTILGIFDTETGEELTYNKEGEICILSNTFMLGYYNEPNLTKSVLKKHSDGLTWLHSGDLGYLNENGQLFVKGRIKRMIMLFSGDKVYPQDIEELLESLDIIDRAIVIPEPDTIHENSVVPCAFITVNQNISFEELEYKIKKVLKENTENFVKINNIYIKDTLPKTSIGKIDLKGLEEEAAKLSLKNKR